MLYLKEIESPKVVLYALKLFLILCKEEKDEEHWMIFRTHVSVETGSGHPDPGHVLSGSSGSDPDTKLSGFDPDSFVGSRALITSSLEWKATTYSCSTVTMEMYLHKLLKNGSLMAINNPL